MVNLGRSTALVVTFPSPELLLRLLKVKNSQSILRNPVQWQRENTLILGIETCKPTWSSSEPLEELVRP